ncbi:MAG: hydroxyisourate hydrolase [Bryobacteraceae bacterium]
MSGISTHILDTEKGRPASGIPVVLERHSGAWELVSEQRSDDNGRIAQLLPAGEVLRAGLYRLTFRTAGPFFPEVSISFRVADVSSHYHVPLLLSPYGYTTYRGS